MKLPSLLIAELTFWMITFSTLFGAPIVTSVTPFVGPKAGGTLVSIMDSGFLRMPRPFILRRL